MAASKLSEVVSCRHCTNIAKMEIVGEINDESQEFDPHTGPGPTYGTAYLVIKCPACEKTNIVSYDWYDDMEEPIKYKFLYPQASTDPVGLPNHILHAYKAAEKVKPIDVNAYAILTRRLLELICMDRGATGGNLATMLKDLAGKNEIPNQLVKVASGLKDFGNIGAHAGSGDLSENQVPIVKALCAAIVEYIYSAPHLASIAETELNKIKGRKHKN